MVNFKSLLARTPQECEQAQRKAQEAFEQQMRSQIEQRTLAVRALHEMQEALSRWERGFVRSMLDKAERFDMNGWLGGELVNLSASQQMQLERLMRLHLPESSAAQASQAKLQIDPSSDGADAKSGRTQGTQDADQPRMRP